MMNDMVTSSSGAPGGPPVERLAQRTVVRHAALLLFTLFAADNTSWSTRLKCTYTIRTHQLGFLTLNNERRQ